MEPTNLWVNEDGERFSPEDKVFLMTTAGNCIMNQFKAFSIIDQDTFDRLHYEGPILGQETKTVAGVPCDEIEDCVNDALEAQNPLRLQSRHHRGAGRADGHRPGCPGRYRGHL